MEQININDIIVSNYNPRRTSDEFLNQLNESISKFGLVDPIIINLKTNTIIGGHQRFKVLKEKNILTLNIIKLGEIGWVFSDENIKIDSEDHEKALNILLNKIHAEFNEHMVNSILLELSDNNIEINLTGFDENELDNKNINFETIGSSFNRKKNKITFEKLICKDIEIELSENEAMKLDAEFNKYLNENTVQFGFLNYLLN